MTASSTDSANRAPLLWHVPYNRNPYFTGRVDDMRELEVSLASSDPLRRVQAIVGLGGVGKTQLALEYAFRHRGEYAIIWWISADEPATLALTFAKLAAHVGLKVPEGANLDDIRHAVRRKLNERDDWLLIFDNAPTADAIRNYIPQDRTGHIIITSRNPNWQNIARAWVLKPLPRPDAIAYLMKRVSKAGGDAAAAARLAQALGDLPLALAQAAACIEQTHITFGDYLHRFETQWADLLKQNRPGGEYPDTVAMTWELSFRQIQEDSPVAADLLSLCAYLAPDDIKKELIRRGADHLPDVLALTVQNPVTFDETIEALLTYSLINATDKSLSVHRLVGALARDRMSTSEQEDWASSAVKLVQAMFRFDSADLSTWETCGDLLPHALTAAGHAESMGVAPRVTVGLFQDAGRYLQKRAQFGEAKYSLERALSLATKFYGESHPRVSAVASNLGRVQMELGDLHEAQASFERCLTIDRNTYGEADPHVATIINNYGVSLHHSGDTDAAREQFEWALSVYENHYGADHAKVASVVNNLGYVLRGAGDLEGARAHFERALEIAQTTYGPNHPIVASILTNLGLVFRMQRNIEVARQYFERALEIAEATQGEEHPGVARAVGHLGALYQDLGLLVSAKEHFERALRIDERVYGGDHLAVATRLTQMGRVLKEMDDPGGAQHCFQRAQQIMDARSAASPTHQRPVQSL